MTTRALHSSARTTNTLAVSATAVAILGSASLGLLYSFDTGAVLSLSLLVGFLGLMVGGWASARVSTSR